MKRSLFASKPSLEFFSDFLLRFVIEISLQACTSDQEESENEEIAKLNPSLLVNGSSFSSRSNSPGPGSLLVSADC